MLVYLFAATAAATPLWRDLPDSVAYHSSHHLDAEQREVLVPTSPERTARLLADAVRAGDAMLVDRQELAEPTEVVLDSGPGCVVDEGVRIWMEAFAQHPWRTKKVALATPITGCVDEYRELPPGAWLLEVEAGHRDAVRSTAYRSRVRCGDDCWQTNWVPWEVREQFYSSLSFAVWEDADGTHVLGWGKPVQRGQTDVDYGWQDFADGTHEASLVRSLLLTVEDAATEPAS